MQSTDYGHYQWGHKEHGREHHKHGWHHGHGHHRHGWGHHRGGFSPLVPLLFLGFLLLGGWKLIFPLLLLAMFGGMLFYMKRHHGGWGRSDWKQWAEESRWRWDDDSEKPKRKNGEVIIPRRKNDDDTLYV